MQKSVFKRFATWGLVVVLVMCLGIAAGFADNEGEDVSGLLKIVELTATQGGVDIDMLDELDFEDEIKIKLEFKVPVIGDEGLAEGEYVGYGDEAVFVLAKGFSLTSGYGPFDLEYNDVKVGTLNLATLEIDTEDPESINPVIQATVVFDGEEKVFVGAGDFYWHDVVCKFDATLKYDGEGSGADDADYEVMLLEKTYWVHVPALPVVLNGEKTGERDGQFIDWVVRIDPTQGEEPADISGYTFSDDLSEVGDFVPGSFKFGSLTDIGDADEVDDNIVYNSDKKLLTYTFPDGTKGERYIFFRTEIPVEMLYSNQNEIVKNKAEVFDGDVLKFSDSDIVDFGLNGSKRRAALPILMR